MDNSTWWQRLDSIRVRLLAGWWVDPWDHFNRGILGDALFGYLCDIRVWATADLHLSTGNAPDGLQCETLFICVRF